MTDFIFLRPYWLLALPLCWGALWWLRRRQASAGGWAEVIDPHLLKTLLERPHSTSTRYDKVVSTFPFLVSLLLVAALAGPSWHKRSAPLYQLDGALVVLLDLSPSMLAQDLKPDRLTQARLKLIDLLRQRREGYTALVAYAGDAHVVSPLTDDSNTIQALLPALHPATMPLPGSQPEEAVAMALALLDNAKQSRGQLLLITDGLAHDAAETILQQVRGSGHRLSVLAVGTSQGAPIPAPRGGFVKDHNGNIVVPAVDHQALERLAHYGGGRFSPLRLDNQDLDRVLSPLGQAGEPHSRDAQRQLEQREDGGYWLLLPLLPCCLLLFRRGTLVAVLLCLPWSQPSHAFSWQDLWQTRDQQGQSLLELGEASQAARHFEDPRRKAAAHYAAGEYQQSAQLLETLPRASDHYNRGNALAQSGRYDEAIAAYQQSLQLEPDNPDARANKALVERLKEQQQPQQPQPSQQQGQQPPSAGGASDRQAQQQDPQEIPGQPQQNGQGTAGDSPQGQQGASQPPSGTNKTAKEPLDQGPEHDPGNDSQVAQQGQAAAADADGGEVAATSFAEHNDGNSDAQNEQLKAWLRKVPDDPSGLLRNKFRYETQMRQRDRLLQSRRSPPDQELPSDRW